MGIDKGVGVHQSYKDEAAKGCDVLFHVSIKGRHMLADDIPLHMSIKIFKSLDEFDLDELKEYVKKNDISSPDPQCMIFKPIIFTSEHTGLKYYMLKIEGLPPKYKALYDKYDKVGNLYKQFMTHVTIDKEIYEDIKENGITCDDVVFSHLVLEKGAGNTYHDFGKSEDLSKGIKHVAAAIGTAAAVMSSPVHNAPKADAVPAHIAVHQPKVTYTSKRMLNTIAAVETQHGKNMQHKPVGGIHGGESAFGKYGLMPNTIRETIGMNRDLKQKYKQGLSLKGDDMRRYMEDNPGLEDAVAQKHLQRLEHHFGKDPAKLGYAWLEGIRGTYKADKAKTNINDHWHVKKINEAYGKEK